MDSSLKIIGIYLISSIAIAILWGRNRQIGVWWTLFLMLGALLIYRNRHDIFASDIVFLWLFLFWFFGLGYFLFKRGLGVSFNRKAISSVQSAPKPENTALEPVHSKISVPKNSHTTSNQQVLTTSSVSEPSSKVNQNSIHEFVPTEQKLLSSNYETKLSFVDYNVAALTYKVNNKYFPVLKIPQKGCVLRSCRKGRATMRGYKEQSFQDSLTKYFGGYFEISGSIQIFNGARPYEPDIALIDKRPMGSIRIDIEIDEPYAGLSRQAIHCDGEDEARDIYFIDRGWIVIRFTERQVHLQELSCLKFVAEILSIIHQAYSISDELSIQADISPEKLWDVLQAQEWEKDHYRESYLNHNFTEIQVPTNEVVGTLNIREQEEERKVKPSYIGKIETVQIFSYNTLHENSRDKRIQFYPEKHLYTIDGTPAESVSSIIEKRFPVFDIKRMAELKAPQYGMSAIALAKKWRKNGEEAMSAGTLLHEQIESYFLRKEYDEIEEMSLFHQFINDHSYLEPYRTEWRIFDELYLIAGTIDLLAKNEDTYEMYDWKRSKKVVDPYTGEPIVSNEYQSGFGELYDIPDTSYNRYCLQQGLYRNILERRYGVKVSKMYLVVLYPKYKQYYKLEVPYWKDKVEYILNTAGI